MASIVEVESPRTWPSDGSNLYFWADSCGLNALCVALRPLYSASVPSKRLRVATLRAGQAPRTGLIVCLAPPIRIAEVARLISRQPGRFLANFDGKGVNQELRRRHHVHHSTWTPLRLGKAHNIRNKCSKNNSMRSEDETSPRPTKRRRISQDYKGISIMKERKRDVNPSKPESYAHIISQEPFKSSSSGVIGRRSISPSHFGGSHVDMNESQSGDIVDTSDNEEMHILHDFQLYRSDAPSPSTYRDPWKHSLKSTSPVAFSQSSSTVRATESSPVIVGHC